MVEETFYVEIILHMLEKRIDDLDIWEEITEEKLGEIMKDDFDLEPDKEIISKILMTILERHIARGVEVVPMTNKEDKMYDFFKNVMIENITKVSDEELEENKENKMLSVIVVDEGYVDDVDWNEMAKELGGKMEVARSCIREKPQFNSLFTVDWKYKWKVFKRLIRQILGLKKSALVKLYIPVS